VTCFIDLQVLDVGDKTEQTTPAPLETKKFKSTLLKSEQVCCRIYKTKRLVSNIVDKVSARPATPRLEHLDLN